MDQTSSQNPIQQLQMLLNQLGNYIYQVNSIITQMNSILSQINNPFLNQINTNLMSSFNNQSLNFNNNLNQNLFNLPNVNLPKYSPINVTFDIIDMDLNIRNIASPNGKINLIIDHDMTLKELIEIFFQKFKGISIDKLKNDYLFIYSSHKIDINSQELISKVFNYNFNYETHSKNVGIKVYQRSL